MKSCHHEIDSPDTALLYPGRRGGKHAIEVFNKHGVRTGIKFIEVSPIVTAYIKLSEQKGHWYCLKCGNLVQEG